MRKLFLTMAAAFITIAVVAQEEKNETPEWLKSIKLSGYGIVDYQASDKVSDEQNSLSLRLMRLIVDGKTGDFDYRIQVQGSSNAGPGAATTSLMDLYAEWRKFDFLKVRAGQFKRAFTFENPTHPIDQGWYSYAHVVNALSGFGDRTGEKSSGGRDIGVQVSGDFLKVKGRPLLHYQVGVYNGEGINVKDKDNRKDIIGGLWVMPINGLRIGGFGWTGTRGGFEIDGKTNQSIRKNRYAISAEYNRDDWTFRAEYIHSQGWGTAKLGDNGTKIEKRKGDKADGLYAFGIVPIIKNKFHAKARYNIYRDEANWAVKKVFYEVGLDYMLTKHVKINLEYARVNEHERFDYTTMAISRNTYNFVDCQLDFRF